MTKKELIDELKKNHQKFLDYIDALSKEEFESSKHQKWTAGQELDHIVKSTFPIANVLNNKTFIKSKFGTIDRDNLNYQALIAKYHYELKNGGKAIGKFIPDKVSWVQRTELKNQLISIVEQISVRLDLYTEEELKELIIPHPLLGALTIQEMLYFTMYHVLHHLENSKRNLRE